MRMLSNYKWNSLSRLKLTHRDNNSVDKSDSLCFWSRVKPFILATKTQTYNKHLDGNLYSQQQFKLRTSIFIDQIEISGFHEFGLGFHEFGFRVSGIQNHKRLRYKHLVHLVLLRPNRNPICLIYFEIGKPTLFLWEISKSWTPVSHQALFDFEAEICETLDLF